MFAALEAIKLFFSSFKVSLKGILILLVLAVVGYGLYKVYDLGKTHQARVDAVQINKAANQITADNKKIGDLTVALTGLQGEVRGWHDKYTKAQGDFDKLQNTTVVALQKQLTESNLRLDHAKKLALDAKRIASYVQVQGMPVTYVPVGVVQLYNGSIEDAASTGIFGTELSGSGQLHASARSTVDLLQLSSVFVNNNAACVQRGVEIKAWQDWYVSTKANWQKVQKAIQDNAPTANQPSPPAANDPVAHPLNFTGKG